MPLRDHFRPPLDNRSSWEGFHGMWPASIVQQLRKQLPVGFIAEPRVHLGTQVEIDIAAFESDEAPFTNSYKESQGGIATATWAPAKATLAVETELPDFDEYEVRVYDVKRGRRLVAALEIVSPANKDRPEHRNAFVAKCVALLREGVAVSIIDLVTTRHFNLYAEVLAFIGHSDPTLSDPPPDLYASSCRYLKSNKRFMLEAWSNDLAIGQPLPTIPLWLSADLALPLDLEPSYEQACYDLWIK